jgi:hypothetical protein
MEKALASLRAEPVGSWGELKMYEDGQVGTGCTRSVPDFNQIASSSAI